MNDDLQDHAFRALQSLRVEPNAPCKVCGEKATPFDMVDFSKTCTLEKYPLGLSFIPVAYRKCERCAFIFTSFADRFTGEQWKRFIYNEDYIHADPEYLEVRPRHNARELAAFLAGKKKSTLALDYGGGNGLTSRLMRQRGWAYDSYDPFGQVEMEADRKGRYNVCSALEVFEHTPDPVASLQELLDLCSSDRLIVFIGTSVHDGMVSNANRLSWWYAAPRNGHISLFSRESLRVLAARYGLAYASFSRGTHVFTRGMGRRRAFASLVRGKIIRRLQS